MNKFFVNIALIFLIVTNPVSASVMEIKNYTTSFLENNDIAYFINVIGSLIVVIALIYITAILYKKVGSITSKNISNLDKSTINKNKLNILSSSPLGQHKSIHVVEINNKILVLGVSEQNISLIKEFEDQSENNITKKFDNTNKLQENKNEFLDEDIEKILKICDKYE